MVYLSITQGYVRNLKGAPDFRQFKIYTKILFNENAIKSLLKNLQGGTKIFFFLLGGTRPEKGWESNWWSHYKSNDAYVPLLVTNTIGLESLLEVEKIEKKYSF